MSQRRFLSAATLPQFIGAVVASLPALPVRAATLRISVNMQYDGYSAEQQGYGGAQQHGYIIAQQQGYGAQQGYGTPQGFGAPQGYGAPQIIWTLAGLRGVTGFSLFAEDPADLQIGRDLYRKDCERYLYLPYALRNGEEQVLSRWNMARPSLTVSRIQCKVHVLADGSAALVSRGRGPTLCRALGGQWSGLYKDQWHMLSDGDQVSLDSNDPEAAVFTCSCQLDGAMQHGGYQQQHDQQQRGDGQLSGAHPPPQQGYQGYLGTGYQGGGYIYPPQQGGY